MMKMKWWSLKLLSAFVAGLFVPLASADILFVDLNASPYEVKAARKAAQRRGEKLFVIPNSNLGQEMFDINYRMKRLDRKRDRNKCYARSSGVCEKLNKQYSELDKQSMALRRANQINAESFKDKLKELQQQNPEITSLVISGHDGNNSFTGSFGTLQDKEVQEAFQEVPEMRDSIRGLHLWGCYTALPGNLDFNWKKGLPNVEVLGGFDKQGPLAEATSNWAVLEDTLVKQEAMVEAKDVKELQSLVKGIDQVNHVYYAACRPGEFASRTKTMSLDDAYGECLDTGFDELIPIYECYQRAEEGCENPPSDHHNSKLREFYNKLQTTQHCNELETFREKYPHLPDGRHVISLIYFDKVQAHFKDIYGQELKDSDEILDRLGVPPHLRLENIDEMSREEILNLHDELRGFLTEKENKEGYTDKDGAELLAAFDILSALNDHLVALSPHCVPFSWVDSITVDKSKCGGGNRMGVSAMVKARHRLPFKKETPRGREIQQELAELREAEREFYNRDDQDVAEYEQSSRQEVPDFYSRRQELEEEYRREEIKRNIQAIDNIAGRVDPATREQLMMARVGERNKLEAQKVKEEANDLNEQASELANQYLDTGNEELLWQREITNLQSQLKRDEAYHLSDMAYPEGTDPELLAGYGLYFKALPDDERERTKRYFEARKKADELRIQAYQVRMQAARSGNLTESQKQEYKRLVRQAQVLDVDRQISEVQRSLENIGNMEDLPDEVRAAVERSWNGRIEELQERREAVRSQPVEEPLSVRDLQQWREMRQDAESSPEALERSRPIGHGGGADSR